MKYLLIELLALYLMCSPIQAGDWISVSNGELAIITSSNAPFPHPERQAGHNYRNQHFNFEEHYNDSSVAVFVPDHFVSTDTIDLVFYFHGWGNNIQKSIDKFDLLDQFSASQKQAIFVFPEGPKNASDSFGGRLEEKHVFKGLVEDVLNFLHQEQKVDSIVPGEIILSGHSGAYRVISFILEQGGLSENISEVYLFDALYGRTEQYLQWLELYNGRFVNITTPDGGTYKNSLEFNKDLENIDLPTKSFTGNDVSLSDLAGSKRITIFTTLGHSEVINPYFKRFLKSSLLSNKF